MSDLLLTGGTGFIGHHIVDWLLCTTEHRVLVLDRLNYAGSLYRLAELASVKENPDRVVPVFHDFRAPFPDRVMREVGNCEYVIHSGAETHVEHSIEDAQRFVDANVTGTTNVLEAARRMPSLKRYVQVSTDEVYGPAPPGVFYREDDRVAPSNPYSASKVAGDSMAYAFHVTHGLPVTITRMMNVFGPRQNAEKFIPLVIQKVLAGETVTIHGNEDEIGSRTWLHAENAASGITYAMTSGEAGKIYNIAGSQEVDNLTLAKRIAEILGKQLNHEFLDFPETRPGHDLRYALDGSRMKDIGWRPVRDFDDSIEQTVNWYMEHPEWL